jgi:hypothetical protein
LTNDKLMTDKFKPLNSNPHYFYGIDYWNIVAQDAFEFFWNSLWGFTGEFPSTGHIIKYCGNPECYSLIAYYSDKIPNSCKRCGKEIDWD